MMKDSLNVAIAGATGYIGMQLIKLLSSHPKVKIIYLCATKSIGKKVNLFGKNPIIKLPRITHLNEIDFNKIDIIFTALPNGKAQSIAKKLPKNIKLIDLSADFRLKKHSEYKKWYGLNHRCKNLINESVYSVTEFSRHKLKKKRIIGCPGCYPTSIQIPLIPLLSKKMIKTENIVIDSKSGYSGAGKNISKKFKHKNLYNSITAYGVGKHRHTSEIDQELSNISKKKIKVTFTPHLMPMFRGILSTIYVETKKNISAKNVYNFLKRYHKKNVFVKFKKFNSNLGTGDVMNTNNCEISICTDRSKNKIIILSAIDNLIKGGSGQAVQNMNVAFNLKESFGLK